MQPTFPQNNRQRPLQKSMFLPQAQQFVNRSAQMDYQYQDIMKRSSINPDTNKFNSFQFNQTSIQPQTPIHQFNTSTSPVLNFSANTRYKQGPRLSQFEQVPQSQVNSQLAIQQLQQKINQVTQLVESHEDILKKHNLLGVRQKNLVQVQVQQIETRIRQNILPTMISLQTKEIYEYIFNFKLEIKTLKQEVTEINDKIKNQMLTIVSGNTKSASTVNSLQRIDKNQESFAELTTNVFSLENKLSELQKSLQNKNQDLKTLIKTQIQKSQINQSSSNKPQTKLKPSTIQSTLSPIMLEYREIFVVKNGVSQSPGFTKVGMSSPRTREQKQILLNSSLYYVDRQGYLLDNQNRYIVDVRGLQIKLQQKHLGLLRQHNVLG